MNKKIIKTEDFLLIYQLLLPICNIDRSGIENDGRLSYYSKLEEWSNIYAYQIELGGINGHEFKNMKVNELIRHNGCTVCNGVRGGSSGAT